VCTIISGMVVVAASEPAPNLLGELERLRSHVGTLESLISSVQSFRSVDRGAPVLKARRGPPCKRCQECRRRRNRDKQRTWHARHPEHYQMKKHGCSTLCAAQRILTATHSW
jgi:hypothetical protein